MLTYPDINPIALQLGVIKIHWYGIMYAIAFMAGWFLLRRQRQHVGWSQSQCDDLLFYSALGVIIGGRLGYLLIYNLSSLTTDPWFLFKTWQGGMSFHGGLVGVCLALWYFCRRHHKSLLATGDLVTPIIPLGLGLGRLGNFINGELWGRPTDLPWAMVFPQADNLARHPSQLYEALGEGLCLWIIVNLFARKSQPEGRVASIFLMAYAIIRFILEYFRAPDWQLGYVALGWLTMGQLLCLPMAVVGLTLYIGTTHASLSQLFKRHH